MGIGFIFSGIYYFVNPQIEFLYEEYTNEQILEMASVIKLEAAKAKDVTDNIDTEDDDTDEVDNNTNGETENNLDEEPGQAQEEGQEDSINDIKDESDNNDTTDGNVEDVEEAEYVTIKIEKGNSSETIAQKLFDVGVIDDVEEFNKFIRDNSAEKKLDYGLLTLKKGDDYKSLLKILTEE